MIQSYEPKYKKALEDRLYIRERCKIDMEFRKEILLQCAEDSVFWCNNFAWTFDPRKKFFTVRHLPFVLFDQQIELVRWIEDLIDKGESGAVEKSRDMGVSYTALVPVILYRWLFQDFNARIGSRKEEFVDKEGDPDTLFWKLKYNLLRLPDWMLPDGFAVDKHTSHMRITRPDKPNSIIGESANPSFARSGRNNLVVFDELGFWGWARASWQAAGESTPTRLAVSTPPVTGKNSFFYKLINSEEGKVNRFLFHYRDDPRKDSDWEAKERENKSQEEFDRELDISYEGSVKGTVYAANFNLCETGEYEYNPDLPLFVSWDFGLDGVAMQWYQWDQKLDWWYLLESYEKGDQEIEYFVPFVTGKVVSDKGFLYDSDELAMIERHKKWKGATHFGDPDVKKRTLVDKRSAKGVLIEHGIYIQSKAWAGRTHYDLKQGALKLLKRLSIDSRYNRYFSDAMRAARYPERSETSQSTTGLSKPIHDWTSHHRTAFEYMADNAPQRTQPKPKEVYYKRKSIWDRS